MANPPCMSEDGNVAVFIGTNLMTGDAAALCQECLPPFLTTLLASMTETDPQKITAAIYGDEIAALAAAEAGGDEPPPPAPADTDPDAADDTAAEGEAADWVTNGTPPPTAPAARGRTRPARSSAAAGTGGEKADDGE